jgi:sporulation protein YlmC with PRC-barrel domain
MAEIGLVIGAAAHCSDGFPGELKSLVVDPGARTVTHLVIEPELEHGPGYGLARLVPLDHVDATEDEIKLRYTEAEFKDLSPAEEALAEYVPVQLLPATLGWRGAGEEVMHGDEIRPVREVEEVDLVPEDEVEEGRGDHIHATDGHVGQLHGLRVNADGGQITQVIVKRHPWSRKELAIPIDKVSGFDAGIQLNIAKRDVRALAS